MESKLTISNVTVEEKNHRILDNVSLSLLDKQIIGLLGRNGAGKTTLLSLISSLRLANSGEVLIDNQIAFENEELMAQVFFVYPKDFSSYSKKVYEYIEWIASYYPNFDREYASELLRLFKLPKNKKVNKLSKGMQSALNSICGLASRASITLLDEAYLSMDAPSRQLFYEELLNDQERFPRLIIISSHLISEAEYLLDEVIFIDQGSIQLKEDYETLTSKAAVISGLEDEVDRFTAGYPIIDEHRIGHMKVSTLYPVDYEDIAKQVANSPLSIEIDQASLQSLFNYLTEGEANEETNK